MSKKGGKFSPEDEAYFEELEKETRKEARLDRKIAKRRDRSQYKKTDQDKQKKTNDLHENLSVQKEDLQRGRVIAVGGERYVVSSEGKEIYCYLRGLLKKDRTRLKNLITIGDFVLFELVDGGEGSICHVEERRSVLARSDNLSRRNST